MIALRVQNLCKSYRITHEATGAVGRYRTLREDLVDMPKRLLSRLGSSAPAGANNGTSEEFHALRDINFEVQQGEVLGIIGRNGAGKSTLLKILSRITEPTSGSVQVFGRVASLLEVGTGFHPELTGRENIFLNGAILGMRRTEIARKFDEIVDFAEVEKFLDTPVKRYSSGMYVRLAFAVAAHLDPDILVVDEVLAVGDAEFQKKCLGKMEDVSKTQGRTVLFVSHQINAVRTLCTHCLLLSKGRLQGYGKASSILADYMRVRSVTSEWRNSGGEHANPYFVPTRFAVVDRRQEPLDGEVRADEPVGVLLEGDAATQDAGLVVGFALYTIEGTLLYWSLQTDTARENWPEVQLGNNRLLCWLPPHMLNEGEYRVELIVSLHCRAWVCQPEVNAPVIHFKLSGGLSESPHWMEARPGLLGPILPFESLAV